MRICSSCSFYSVDVDLPEVQALPLALSLSPVKRDLFPALSAFSLSALNFHPEDPAGTLELGRAFLRLRALPRQLHSRVPVPMCCWQELAPSLPPGLGTLTHGTSATEQLPPASLIQ